MRDYVTMTFFLLSGLPLSAQGAPDLVAIAEAQGACVPFGVATAVLDSEGALRVTCNEDATAFVPLIGGLGPVLGLGAAATVASAIAGGNATPDTQ
jgi:hypothetical protein